MNRRQQQEEGVTTNEENERDFVFVDLPPLFLSYAYLHTYIHTYTIIYLGEGKGKGWGKSRGTSTLVTHTDRQKTLDRRAIFYSIQIYSFLGYLYYMMW